MQQQGRYLHMYLDNIFHYVKGTQQVLQRKYVALVLGRPRHPKGLLSAPLAKVCRNIVATLLPFILLTILKCAQHSDNGLTWKSLEQKTSNWEFYIWKVTCFVLANHLLVRPSGVIHIWCVADKRKTLLFSQGYCSTILSSFVCFYCMKSNKSYSNGRWSWR